MDKFYGQQCQDEFLNNKFRKLHKFIINQIINFCKSNHISIDEFSLNADRLAESIEAGSWQACTDSGFTFMKYSEEYKKAFWKMDKDYLKGKSKKDLDTLAASQKPFMFSM
jgi:hypothetical protein